MTDIAKDSTEILPLILNRQTNGLNKNNNCGLNMLTIYNHLNSYPIKYILVLYFLCLLWTAHLKKKSKKKFQKHCFMCSK